MSLAKLAELCRCGVTVEVNPHRPLLETAEQHLRDLEGMGGVDEIRSDVRREMEKRDSIVMVQAYPRTPIGSYTCWHYDLESALAEVLAAVEAS